MDERIGIQAIHCNTTPISSSLLHQQTFPTTQVRGLREEHSVHAVCRRRTGTKTDFTRYESAPLHHIPERLQLRDPKRHDHEDDDAREERQAEDVRAEPGGIEPLRPRSGRHVVGRQDAETGCRLCYLRLRDLSVGDRSDFEVELLAGSSPFMMDRERRYDVVLSCQVVFAGAQAGAVILANGGFRRFPPAPCCRASMKQLHIYTIFSAVGMTAGPRR